MNYLPYEQQEEISAIIPRGEEPKASLPDTAINEQAFYASAMYSDTPIEDFHNSRLDLQGGGESELVSYAHESWRTEQQLRDQNIVQDIISDPSIDNEQKKHVVLGHALGLGVSNNLRDKYTRQMLTENTDVTQADVAHRDYWIDLWNKNNIAEAEGRVDVEQDKLNLAKEFNPSWLDFAGGIARNMIAGMYGAQIASSKYATMLRDNAEMGGVNVGWEMLKAFIFPGSANKEMNELFNSMDAEGKAKFIKDFGDGVSVVPGFDWNRWEGFRDTLDSPEGVPGWVVGLENVAGILDVVGLTRFAAAGFAGGFLRAAKSTIRHYTTIDLPASKASPRPKESDRIDPTLNRAAPEGAPNPPTGSLEGIEPSTIKRTQDSETPLSVEDYTNLSRVRMSPKSPAGTLEEVNPKKAKELFTHALTEDSDDLAKAMGTNKAEILSDTVFPKLDKDVLQHADIAQDIRKMDEYFNGVLKDTEFDPYFVTVTQREKDKEILFQTFKESKGAQYQQANSVVRETIDSISGTAVYGRNDAYGFTSAEDAQKALEDMKVGLNKEDADALYVNQNNGQWFVHRPYHLEYDPYSSMLFGKDAVSASFFGIDASGLARSGIAKYIWHPTQRLPEWVVKAAARASKVTGKVNADFMHYIQSEIKKSAAPKFLNDALIRVQENQVWESFKDFSTRMHGAGYSTKDIESTYKGYVVYKRLTDYQHTLTNRTKRRQMEAEGFQGIYDEAGVHIGNGTTQIKKQPKEVWDFDLGISIRTPEDLQGRSIIKLEEAIDVDGVRFEHAILGSKAKLGELPENVVTKIEGYVPRKNVENFYVIKTPRSVRVDGELISDKKTLLDSHTHTIGAGATKKEAEQLAEKFRKEYPEYDIAVKPERSDAQDSIITDHKVYKEMLEHSKKRGERLPTLYGQARLENPLEALWSTIQASVRLDVWKDYDAVFKKNWLKQYGEFTKGEFPQVLTDITAHGEMSTEAIKQFKSAQRLFEQYTNQRYHISVGDEMWKNGFHMLADSIENVVPQWLSQALRDTAGQGNIPIRTAKSLASNLFLYLNPPRQWIVQTQQLAEWSLLDKDYLKIAPTVIPSILMAVTSKAAILGKHGNVMYAAAHKLSGMSKKEFDATVKALYTEGIPQSVDLNMMLHGAFHEAKQMLDPSLSRTVGNLLANTVKFPGQVGKTAGYTPAELANTVGTWLFTRARWQKQNPGKNWNTPENIAIISGDAWEIGKAMSTRAGSFPYQDGVASLFFQFTAVQHKAFMEIFSSKTFTPKERAKLAAVRALLWGPKGLALGGTIAWLIGEHTDTLTQKQWNELEGGLVDYVANTAIDAMLRKPGEKPSDLSISSSMSPMPEHAPYVDFIINAKQLFDNDPRMPRFAFTGAVGNAMKAAEEIKHIFQVNEMGTEISMQQSILELAKLTSGYNNAMKAIMLKEMDDKIDKFGNRLGISSTRSQVVAQMFGIISKEEEHLYKINESLRDRKDFVETRAKEIHLALTNLETRYGTPEFTDFVRRQRILNSFTPVELQRDVEAEVDKLQLMQFESKKENAYTQIMRHSQAESDKFVNHAMGFLGVSKNPKDQEIYKNITNFQKEMRENIYGE